MLTIARNSSIRNFLCSSRCFFSSDITKQSKIIVGVNVLLIRDNKILLGPRLNSIQAGTWGAPGGHLETGETPTACAIREAKEETGLELTNAELLTCVTGVFKEINTPYRSYFVLGTSQTGEPKVLEPHKCKKWQWFDLNHLPKPLFSPIQNWLDQHSNIESLLNLSNQVRSPRLT